MQRKPKMPRRAIVKAGAGGNQNDHQAAERPAGLSIDPHFPTAADVIKPQKTEERADDGIEQAVGGLAKGSPSGQVRALFPLLVDVPKPKAGEKAQSKQEN